MSDNADKLAAARKLLEEQFRREHEALEKTLESSREERAIRDANRERNTVGGDEPIPKPKGAARGEKSFNDLVTEHRQKWERLDRQELAKLDGERDAALRRLEKDDVQAKASALGAEQLAKDVVMEPQDFDPSRPPRRGRDGLKNEFKEQARPPDGFTRASELGSREYGERQRSAEELAERDRKRAELAQQELERQTQRERPRER